MTSAGGVSAASTSAASVGSVASAGGADAASYSLFAGGLTDEGVAGKVNQDDFFVWRSADGKSYVMGVFDGHGRELGHFAARATRECFSEKLGNEAALAALRVNPNAVLSDAFEAAHAAVIKVCRMCCDAVLLHGAFSLACSVCRASTCRFCVRSAWLLPHRSPLSSFSCVAIMTCASNPLSCPSIRCVAGCWCNPSRLRRCAGVPHVL